MYMSFLRSKTDYLVKYSAECPIPNMTSTSSERLCKIGTVILGCINDPAYLQNSFLRKYIPVSTEESVLAHQALFCTVSFFSNSATLDSKKLSNNSFLQSISESAIMYRFQPETLNCSLDKDKIPTFEVLHHRPQKLQANGGISAQRVEINSEYTMDKGERLSFEMQYQPPCDLYGNNSNLTQTFKINSVQEAVAIEFIKYCEAIKDRQTSPFSICRYCNKVFSAKSRSDKIYCSPACKNKWFSSNKDDFYKKYRIRYQNYNSEVRIYIQEGKDGKAISDIYNLWKEWAKSLCDMAVSEGSEISLKEFDEKLKSEWKRLKKEGLGNG